MLEAISRKHLITKSRYPNGAWWDTRLHWKRPDSVALATLCHTNADIEKAAAGLGRTPKALANRAADTGLILPREWRELIYTYRRREREPKVLLQYPYIKEVRGEHETLLAVNSLVPQGLPGQLRADVCQEMLADIYLGEASLEELTAESKLVRKYITRMKKDNYEGGGYAISLDQPMYDGRSWYDVLPEPEPSTDFVKSFDDLGELMPNQARYNGERWQEQKRRDAAAREKLSGLSGPEYTGLELEDDDLIDYRERGYNDEPEIDGEALRAFAAMGGPPKIISPKPPRKRPRKKWIR